ncbi:MAG: OmpA family protein [Proteobacteria bacterium]|nr:OmpA family protein [Pseudomonadota bacterium]
MKAQTSSSLCLLLFLAVSVVLRPEYVLAGLFGTSEYEKCSNEKLAGELKYKYCYRDKAAAERELEKLTRQYGNEKSLRERILKEKENAIANLDQKIALLEKQRREDGDLSASRMAELRETVDILQKKSSHREKDLIEENKKLQTRYENELGKALEKLRQERNERLEEVDALKRDFEDRIAPLKTTVKNLNEELSSLKKLTGDQRKELERMTSQERELQKKLQEEIKLGQIRLKKFHDRLIINIDNRISFDSGSAELKVDILPAFDKISGILASYPENRIIVEGHTDTDKVRAGPFKDNWQLSTQRALSVLRYLLKNQELDKSRFAAAGFGEFNPIVPNDTPGNKALNRRVDIVLIQRIGD